MSGVIIDLKEERFFINILCEVCWGFLVEDFEGKIGEKEVVENLLERLLKDEKLGVAETYLSDEEVNVFRKCLIEVEREIEEWEFFTRIGYSLEEVKKSSVFR